MMWLLIQILKFPTKTGQCISNHFSGQQHKSKNWPKRGAGKEKEQDNSHF